MNRLIVIFITLALLSLLSGCTAFENKKVEFTHKNSLGKVIESWELNTPAEAHAELKTDKYHLIYDGKTANILKDLLLMKVAETEVIVSNKEGK